MRKRLAWIAAPVAVAALVAFVAFRTTTPDDERAVPADPPVRRVSPPRRRPVPPARTQSPEPLSVPDRTRPDRRERPYHGMTVRGSIVYASSEHPSGARVALARIDDTHPSDPQRLLISEPAVWLDGGVDFNLHPDRPGRYLLGVVFCDGTIGARADVEVPENGTVEQDLNVSAIEVHERVLVRVIEPDGRVAQDAAVQAGFTVGRSGKADLDTVIRIDETGTASVVNDFPDAPRNGLEGTERLPLHDDGSPPELRHFIEASSPRFPTRRVEYDPRRETELTIRFAAPALLTVTVDGLPSSPDADQLRVVLVPAAGGAAIGQSYEGDGRFAFYAADPGDYELRLELARRDDPVRVLSRQTLALAVGERAVDLRLPRLFNLTVELPADAHVDRSTPRLVRIGDATRDVVTSRPTIESSKLVFKGLVESRYRLTLPDGETSGEMTFDLTSDLTLTWRPGWNAMRVELDGFADADAIGRAGLATDDLVVAIDGVQFDGLRRMYDAILRAQPNATARLTVLRDGRRFDVDVTMGLFQGSAEPKWLRPASR